MPMARYFLTQLPSGCLGISLAQISPRMSVFLFTLSPAALCRTDRRSAQRHQVLWIFILYRTHSRADLHFPTDRSIANHIHLCLWFIALLCPMVFGFRRDVAGARTVLTDARRLPLCAPHHRRNGFVLIMMIVLALSHEGALIFAVTIMLTLALRGLSDASSSGSWSFACHANRINDCEGHIPA